MSTPAKTRNWTSPIYDPESSTTAPTTASPSSRWTIRRPTPTRYEMMRQLDDAILRGALRRRRARDRAARRRREVLLRRRRTSACSTRSTPSFKYYFCLHANETLLAPRADAQAGDRGAQRPLRRRRPRDRDGVRPAHRAQGRRQDRPARSRARRAARHRRHAAAGAARRQVARDRADGHRQHVLRSTRRCDARAWSTTSSTRRPSDVLAADHRLREAVLPPNKAPMAVGHIKRAVQTGAELPLERRSRSSASCSSCSSRATTPRKASPPTTKSASEFKGQ